MAKATRDYVPNPKGNPDALVPAPKGNTRGLQHGFYSKRILAERASEIVDGLLALPWTQPIDRLACEEVASLLASLEAIDRALADGKTENRRGEPRKLLQTKATLSRELRAWLSSLGALPSERASWALRLAEPSFAERVAAKKAELEAARNGG